jgi:hypothetical protein
MRTQVYRGGDKYTGVDIEVFMDKSDDIKTYLQELKHPLNEATDKEISDICDLSKRVLRLLDILFSLLRKNYGGVTNDDIVTYEQTADQAALVWQKLDLNYTPSFHYVHKEAPRPLKLHRRFGELTEEHLEQSHPNMDKIHRRLGRLGFAAKRAMVISRLENMATDPELIKKMASVKDETKKKLKKPSKSVLRSKENCTEGEI